MINLSISNRHCSFASIVLNFNPSFLWVSYLSLRVSQASCFVSPFQLLLWLVVCFWVYQLYFSASIFPSTTGSWDRCIWCSDVSFGLEARQALFLKRYTIHAKCHRKVKNRPCSWYWFRWFSYRVFNFSIKTSICELKRGLLDLWLLYFLGTSCHWLELMFSYQHYCQFLLSSFSW